MTAHYVAHARRSGDWWAISVPEVPGVFSQAKRLDQVAAMARDALALFLGVTPRSLDVELDVSVDEALRAEINELDELRAQAETASADYAAALRSLITLMSSDFSMRDIAMMTRLSFQRVGQILNDQRVGPAGVNVVAQTRYRPGRATAKVASKKATNSTGQKVTKSTGQKVTKAAANKATKATKAAARAGTA